MRTSFRNPFKAAPTPATSSRSDGPGPNCPIRWSVDPRPEAKQECLAALKLLRSSKQLHFANGAAGRLPVSVKRQETRAVDWLGKWYKEHNRLMGFYTTLRKGLKDPAYAPKFQAFHASMMLLRFLRAPNQVGKSYAAAAEVLFYATGKHPWKRIPAKWADPNIAKTILIVTGSDKNREGVYQALWNLCPVDEIDWVHTHYDTRNMWGVRNPVIVFPKTNTKIIFRSSNQDTDSLNSLTVDGIWIDEPPKAGTIDEIRRSGLARGAWVIMSFTPVGEEGEDFTWLRHYVEGDDDLGILPRGDWEQHVIGIADCPWFDKDELEARRSAFREEQTPQRLFGEWESAAIDRAFTHFKESGPQRTVMDRFELADLAYPEEWFFAVGTDHGEKAGTQVSVLIAYTLEGFAIVLAEYVSRTKTTTKEDAEGIVEMLASVGLSPAQVSLWVGDINTGGKEVKGEKLNVALRRELLNYSEAVPGIRIPNKYPGSVALEERRINAGFKERRLFVHTRCKTLQRSLRHYRGTGVRKDSELKHILDATRYALQVVLDRMGVAVVYSREYTGQRKLSPFRAKPPGRLHSNGPDHRAKLAA